MKVWPFLYYVVKVKLCHLTLTAICWQMKQTCSIFMSKLPCLSRNFLESFASQIRIPFLHNSFAFVQPLTNQRRSSAIPCQNTHFVVRRWNTLLHRLNLIWTPKMEWVPVPVSDILYLQIQSYVQCFNCSVYLFYFSCFKGHKIISICILHYISIKIIYYSQLLNFKKWKFGLYCIML